MCRFVVARFQKPTQPTALLQAFAEMAQKSKALDGDWQGDGWGVAWMDEGGSWQVQTSLAPVWEESSVFSTIPATSTVVAHARSASFPHHKGVLEYNQPYVFGSYAFVFNGLLKGVSLPDVPGRIGAEKICHLLKQELAEHPPEVALANIKALLLERSKEIVALNLGLVSSDTMHTVNHFSRNPEYYSLHEWQDENLRCISSEPLFVTLQSSSDPSQT